MNATVITIMVLHTDVTVVVDEASSNVFASEGDAVHLCARMMGRADFVVSASFQPYAIPGSALAGDDFAMDPQELQFPANSADQQCVDIQTADDSVVEGPEEFGVRLEINGNENPKISLGARTSVNITISDNDCEFPHSADHMSCDDHVISMCAVVDVGFEEAEYSIIESDGEIEVCGVLTGRQDIPVAVTFSVLDPPGRDQSKDGPTPNVDQ